MKNTGDLQLRDYYIVKRCWGKMRWRNFCNLRDKRREMIKMSEVEWRYLARVDKVGKLF